MDYSQIPNDPDNPAGTSPWQSSPRQSSRASYTTSTGGSEPPSPVARNSTYRNGMSRPSQDESSDDGTMVARRSNYTTNEDSEQSAAPTEVEPSSPDLSTRLQSPPLTEGDFDGHQQQYLQQQQHQQRQQSYQQQQRPSRYQGGTRPRQNTPQYKLQAKITGLERTGRKGPILRFDVHVSVKNTLVQCRAHNHRPTYPNSEPLSSVTSAAHILSSSNSQSI